MSTDKLQLPMRGNGENLQIEVRPMYIEEWLDSLPYVDFQNTSQLLHEALHIINKVPMKPSQRNELISLFNRPYRYYLETQIRADAHQTLQNMNTIQTRIKNMKSIAIDLSKACRIVIEDAAKHKSLWGQTKHPTQAILMSLNYLSHLLLLSYLEYAPEPRHVWQELNFLYQYAEGLNQHRASIKIPASGKKNTTTTIEHDYLRIALATLVDPYHLPYGAIWEVYEQLDEWATQAVIEPFKTVSDPRGYFVVNLGKDTHPVPYMKFDINKASKHHRLIDANKILAIVEKYRKEQESGKKADNSLVFTQSHCGPLLNITYQSWSMPAKRTCQRHISQGQLELTHGFHASFFYINKKKGFNSAFEDSENNDVVVDDGLEVSQENEVNYPLETWELVDKSKGGIAVKRDSIPDREIHVGDLICLKANGKETINGDWYVGVIRWLVVSNNITYRAGIQLKANRAYSSAVRACTGNQIDRQYKRALLLENPAQKPEFTAITNRGLYQPERELEFKFNNAVITSRVNNLVDSSFGFEQFRCARNNINS